MFRIRDNLDLIMHIIYLHLINITFKTIFGSDNLAYTSFKEVYYYIQLF